MNTLDFPQPYVHEDVRALLDQKSLVSDLSLGFGGTIHVLFPEIFASNVEAFLNVGLENNFPLKIYYAAKANKAETFLEMALKENIGVDVSSLYEFRAALNHGILGKNISVSGPSKDKRLLLLAARYGAQIVIDDVAEIDTLDALPEAAFSNKVPVLLRLSQVQQSESRFGIPQETLSTCYERLLEHPRLWLRGVSFHIDSYSIEERALALDHCITEIERLREMGFEANFVNIGGGFTVQYMSEENAVLARESEFYKGKRPASFYPYGHQAPKEKFLEMLLLSKSASNPEKTLRELIIEKKIQLIIEPGRALLDQAGITLMPVRQIRKSSRGAALVVVDGNMNYLSEQWFDTDFLPGPILLPLSSNNSDPFEGSVVGNTCMENDVVTWRKVHFSHTPQRDDLLVYVNTAGYQMDSNESSFHQLPLPPKFAIFLSTTGNFSWKTDQNFSYLDINSHL